MATAAPARAAEQPRSFYEEIRRNERRTWVILAVMFLLLWGVVFVGGYLLGATPWISGILAIVVGGGYLWVTWHRGVDTVLRAADARPANEAVRAEKLLIYRVEEMALAAGLPAPKVYVQESKDPNAFAAGLTPETAIICCTTGGLEMWDQEELEGVIAHEMSHVMNRDVRLATVTVAVVGAVAMLAEIFLRTMWFTGGGRGRGNRDAGPVLLVVGILLLVLAPIFTRLTYLAMSRNREYLADASAVRLTRDPEGLAGALEKLEKDVPDDPQGSRTVAALYIGNPWKRTERASLWSTHPPLPERIRRIRSMS